MSIQPFDPGTSPPTPPKRGLLTESGPLPGETPPATAATEPNPPQAPASPASGFTSGASWQAPDNPAPRDYSALRPVGGGVVGDNGQQVGVGNPQAAMGPASGGLIDPATLMAMHDRAGYEQYRGGGIDAALGTVGANIAARARESQYVQQMNAWRQNQAATDRAAMEAMLGGSGASAAARPAAPAGQQPQPASGQPTLQARGLATGAAPMAEKGPTPNGLASGATPAPAPGAAQPQAAADPNALPMGQYNQYMQKQADLARIYGQSPDPAVRAKGLAIAQQIQDAQNPITQAKLQRDYQKTGLDIQAEEANIRKADAEASKAGVVEQPFGSSLVDIRTNKPVGGSSGSGGGMINLGAIGDMNQIPAGKDGIAYIRQRDTGSANFLEGLLSGQTQFNRSTVPPNAAPQVEALLHQLDPSWSEAQAVQRAHVLQELNDPKTTGSMGWNQYAVNKSIEHLKSMWDLSFKLPNYNNGVGSSITNWAGNEYNKFNNDPIVSQYNSEVHNAAPEIAKFVGGKAPAEGENERMASDFDPTKGGQAVRAAILGKLQLMSGNLNQLNDQLRRSLGPTAKIDDLLSDESQKALAGMTDKPGGANALTKFGSGRPAPPPAAVQMLRSNATPQMQQHFDEIFGPGAAQGVLSGQ